MKAISILVVFGALLFIGADAPAPRAPVGAPAAMVSGGLSSGEASLPSLKDNVSLTVKGPITPELSINFIWTGNGPTLSADTLTEGREDKNLMHFSGTIEQVANGYRLDFSLTGILPIRTPGTTVPQTTAINAFTYKYVNLGLTNSVVLKLGAPVTVLDQNGQKVVMTLVKATRP